MPRKRWTFIIGGVVAALTASAVLASTELSGPGVIRITDREVSRRIVDLGPRGWTSGDLLISDRLLYNKRITDRAIGHEELICTYLGRGGTFGGGSRHCEATFFLPKGKIVAQGTVHSMFFYEVAVVGGTGIYNNVGGTLTVTFLGGTPRRELLYFRLTV